MEATATVTVMPNALSWMFRVVTIGRSSPAPSSPHNENEIIISQQGITPLMAVGGLARMAKPRPHGGYEVIVPAALNPPLPHLPGLMEYIVNRVDGGFASGVGADPNEEETTQELPSFKADP